MKTQIYRIDDVLLRAGAVALFAFFALAACVVVVGLAEGTTDGRDPGFAALARHGLLLAGTALCPVGLLGAGITLRRREKRILAVWNLLKQNAELSAAALVANSDFSRTDLDRAVRFLNNRGLGHYVWDRKTDTIQDARLHDAHLHVVHVEKCDACGARVRLDIPVASREIPKCPYCHDPVSLASLRDRRREAVEALRAEHRPRRGPGESESERGASFSLPIFVLLLFVFWPAALGYAWLKWR